MTHSSIAASLVVLLSTLTYIADEPFKITIKRSDDRVEMKSKDDKAMFVIRSPFGMVLSSLAIHNISGRAGREKAISEAVRVLRPGGRLLIVDVRGTRQYQAQLVKLGMYDVARRGLGWWSWPARLVTATKPQLGN